MGPKPFCLLNNGKRQPKRVARADKSTVLARVSRRFDRVNLFGRLRPRTESSRGPVLGRRATEVDRGKWIVDRDRNTGENLEFSERCYDTVRRREGDPPCAGDCTPRLREGSKTFYVDVDYIFVSSDYIVMSPALSSLLSSRSRRFTVWAGAIALLIAVGHVIAFFVMPEAIWSGPVGLRKPIVFGVSSGITLWTVVWIVSHLRVQPRLHAIILYGMSIILLIEMAIIAGQRFRGVPSHFNLATNFDAALWSLMGAAITVFALLAFLLAALAWQTSSAPPALRAAFRGSLLIFAAAQISGQFLAVHGSNAVLIDGQFIAGNLATAATYGAAGNLKLPHALALHAIQAIPLLAVLLSRLAIPATFASSAIWTSVLGFAGLVSLMQYQALLGRSPADLAAPATLILGTALTLFLLPWGLAICALARAGVRRPCAPSGRQHA